MTVDLIIDVNQIKLVAKFARDEAATTPSSFTLVSTQL
jgi:hypothetical protein